jgi:multisubunit Na+/H+ antiporter MnhB subunit
MKTVDSFIAKAVIGLVFLLVNIISIYLLLRGHNLPGGGFIGGLTMGMSFTLLGLIRGWTNLQREMPMPPLRMASFGLLLAILSGVGPMLAGKPFLTQYNLHIETLPSLDKLHIGTPLIFDIGVFLLVGFMTVKLIIVLARSTSGFTAFTRSEARYYASILEEPIEGAEAIEGGVDAD